MRHFLYQRLAAALLCTLAMGCSSTLDVFTCDDSADCVNGAEDGVCEADNLCSYEDAECSSGRRYGSASGDQSETCVEESPEFDGGVIDTVDGGVGGNCDPSAAILSDQDVATHADCRNLQRIELFDTDLTGLNLPSLELVTGNIVLSSERQLEGVSFESLIGIGGELTVSDNGKISQINMPMLSDIGGSIDIATNNNLNSINLDTLDHLGSDFTIFNNEDLETFDVAALAEGTIDGNTNISSNNQLCLEMSVMEWAAVTTGFVNIEDNKTNCP